MEILFSVRQYMVVLDEKVLILSKKRNSLVECVYIIFPTDTHNLKKWITKAQGLFQNTFFENNIYLIIRTLYLVISKEVKYGVKFNHSSMH